MLLRGDPADMRMAGTGRKHQAAGHGFGPGLRAGTEGRTRGTLRFRENHIPPRRRITAEKTSAHQTREQRHD